MSSVMSGQSSRLYLLQTQRIRKGWHNSVVYKECSERELLPGTSAGYSCLNWALEFHTLAHGQTRNDSHTYPG